MLKEYKNEAEEVMFVTKEPTLNPNLASCVQYAKNKGIRKWVFALMVDF